MSVRFATLARARRSRGLLAQRLARLVVIGVLPLVAGRAAAQPAPAGVTSPLLMPRPVGRAASGPAPTVDGDVLGDGAWTNVPAMSGFVQEQPFEGQPSTERTEVRFLVTADTLYVGVVCYDTDPAGIIVSDSRRDAPLEETDSFRLILDTYRDRQNGFVFGTNPAGIEYDGQVTNEGQGGGGLSNAQMQMGGSGSGFNLNWDGAWTVRARISDVGWSAEFAIPFKTLRYPAGRTQVWGVNFQRNIRRRNERSYWAPIPRQFSITRASLAGSVEDIAVPVFRNLKLMPYVLGNVVTSGENPAKTNWLGDVGGDLKYNLTPSLTLDATVNTDFAQVEVDDQQVNLDRFNLFFPEKRPFFLENAGFFAVGNPGEVDLFFSRAIGISPTGRPIPILGGGRVSGKVGAWNVGLLDMQTDSLDATRDAAGVPSNNFAVIRLNRELPNRSQLGVLFTNRNATGDYARPDDSGRTYAVDGRLGIGLQTFLSGFFSATEGDRKPTDTAFNVRSRTNTRRWDLDLGFQQVGTNFNPEVGFLTRSGYRKPDVRVMTRFRPKDFLGLQEVRPHASYRSFWGFDGFQETMYTHLDNHWQFRNAYEVHTGMNLTTEGVRTPFQIYPGVFVPPGTYNNAEGQFVFQTNLGAPVSYYLQTYIGGFFSGNRVTTNHTFRLRLGEAFTTETSYSLNDVDLPQGHFRTNLIRSRVNYSFTPRTFVQSLIQYNDRADLWSMNIRFGWLQAANTGLFIVYNDTRYLYDLVQRPERTDRSLTIKYSRMFDLLK
ncbi:DUF5916 domain-containing protein [Luteitalea sp.]|uniref:DUF5916 domain-containing protein n=1 Tax=Luteitalea sp. TaxID=2004800 RepID=UPI0037C52094